MKKYKKPLAEVVSITHGHQLMAGSPAHKADYGDKNSHSEWHRNEDIEDVSNVNGWETW